MVIQSTRAEEYYDDESAQTAWIVFWLVVGRGISVVAFGGNCIRWKVCKRWILMSGPKKSAEKSKEEKKKKGKRGGNQDDDGMDHEEGLYVQTD